MMGSASGAYNSVLKRALDFSAASVCLVVCVPLILFTSLILLVSEGRPVFFIQTRAGLDGRPFQLIKFRTMESVGGKSTGRIGRIGRILRVTSFDELPSLWNIARGDMSFVGPRPLLLDYLSIYSPRHSMRHKVRPGLTGLAQVMGRNNLSWHQRFEYDVTYVEDLSFLLDLKILARTLAVVFSQTGAERIGGGLTPRLDNTYHIKVNQPGL